MRRSESPRRGGTVRSAALCALLVVASGKAAAIDWKIEPRIAGEETYTSNVRLAPKGEEESDLITRISPGVSIRGRTPHIRTGLEYDPELLLYAKTSEGNGVRNNLAGFFDSVFFDRHLALDARASIVQTFASPLGSVSGAEPLTLTTTTPTRSSDVAVNDNLVEVRTLTFSPAWRQRLGTFADGEVRYRFGLVMTNAEEVSDTLTHSLSGTLRGTPTFLSALTWTTRLSQDWTDRAGGRSGFGGTGDTSLDETSVERRLARLDLGYRILSNLSLLGGFGWEEIEDPTLLDPPSGPTWELGFEYRLRPNSSIRMTYGRRFDDSNLNIDSRWQIGSTTTLALSYTESLQTSQSSFLNRTAQIGVDADGNLIDLNTGLPFRADDRTLGLTSQTFREESFQASVRSTRGRNSYSALVRHQTRTAEAPSEDSEQTMGVGLGFSRRLTPHMTYESQLDYRRVTFGGTLGGDDDLYTLSSGLSLSLSESAALSFRARHTERRSTEALRELSETLLSVRLSKSF